MSKPREVDEPEAAPQPDLEQPEQPDLEQPQAASTTGRRWDFDELQRRERYAGTVSSSDHRDHENGAGAVNALDVIRRQRESSGGEGPSSEHAMRPLRREDVQGGR